MRDNQNHGGGNHMLLASGKQELVDSAQVSLGWGWLRPLSVWYFSCEEHMMRLQTWFSFLGKEKIDLKCEAFYYSSYYLSFNVKFILTEVGLYCCTVGDKQCFTTIYRLCHICFWRHLFKTVQTPCFKSKLKSYSNFGIFKPLCKHCSN